MNKLSPTLPALLDKQQLADQLQCSKAHVQNMFTAGIIPHVVLGRKLIRFDLEAVIEALKNKPHNDGL